MLIAIVVFVAGRRTYTILLPTRNVVLDTCRAVALAVRLRWARWRSNGGFHLTSHETR